MFFFFFFFFGLFVLFSSFFLSFAFSLLYSGYSAQMAQQATAEAAFYGVQYEALLHVFQNPGIYMVPSSFDGKCQLLLPFKKLVRFIFKNVKTNDRVGLVHQATFHQLPKIYPNTSCTLIKNLALQARD